MAVVTGLNEIRPVGHLHVFRNYDSVYTWVLWFQSISYICVYIQCTLHVRCIHLYSVMS